MSFQKTIIAVMALSAAAILLPTAILVMIGGWSCSPTCGAPTIYALISAPFIALVPYVGGLVWAYKVADRSTDQRSRFLKLYLGAAFFFIPVLTVVLIGKFIE